MVCSSLGKIGRLKTLSNIDENSILRGVVKLKDKNSMEIASLVRKYTFMEDSIKIEENLAKISSSYRRLKFEVQYSITDDEKDWGKN